MIVRLSEIEPKEVVKPRDGRGSLINFGYEAATKFGGKIKMFSVVELKPDSKVGYHVHENDMEIYLILDGKAVVSDNGNEDLLGPGDMLITPKGEGHAIENKTNEPITFLAVIIE
ncbi:cupin domain-containing protein [Deferribacter autotrophicus]|uniref:Cupin domain-containing protein n=1 Tax=Deferribacter autotrophicus TaxID=500465 RepID=A0A5A8F5S6_9BACT|nr:cupin domain-containing protein [Deferribacter autotrophicus]KAA0259050.1 cupin domain-containing protein [Deferribacter autotrophicus]